MPSSSRRASASWYIGVAMAGKIALTFAAEYADAPDSARRPEIELGGVFAFGYHG